MDKITRSMLEASLGRVAVKVGKTAGNPWRTINGKNVATVGCWTLDYNPVYGGYIVEETVNAAGGVTHPLLGRRVSARELWNQLYAGNAALTLKGGY